MHLLVSKSGLFRTSASRHHMNTMISVIGNQVIGKQVMDAITAVRSPPISPEPFAPPTMSPPGLGNIISALRTQDSSPKGASSTGGREKVGIMGKGEDMVKGIKDKWQGMSHLQRFEAEAALAGVAYLTYSEWKKHSNAKKTEADFKAYQQERLRLEEEMYSKPTLFSMSQGENSPITPEISRIQYEPYPGGITSQGHGRSVAHKLDKLENFKSVIGSYLDHERTHIHRSREARSLYKYSLESIVVYNYLMNQLEGLNYHVLGAKHNKGGLFRGRAITADLWIDAVKLFRLELFNDLCKANPLVAMFSKHISTRFDEHPRGVDYLELYGNHVAHPRHAARPGKRKPNMDADPALFAQVRTLFLVDDSGSMTREGHASWSSLSDMSFMPFASKARGILTDLATGLMSGADSNALTPWFCNMCAFDNRAPIAFLCELCLAPGPQAPILPPIPTLNPNITKMRGIVGVGGGESGPALSGKSRWIQVRTLLAGMTDRIAQYNKRGVDVMFLNNSRVHGGVRQGEWMTAVFDGVGVPVGGTPTGASMHEILDAYTAVLRYDATFEALNVVVLTDGNANDFDLLQYTISHHVEMLTQRGCVLHQLGVEFVQVGDDEVATAQLDLLEEAVDAHRRNHARDVVGVTTARTIQCMDAEYATKLILAGIDARVHGYIRQSPQNH